MRAGVGWLLLASRCSLAAPAVSGVPPGSAGLYEGAEFACRDGVGSLPASAVNDDFCDCPDGSDEPGTAACSGLGPERSQEPGFYCPNAMARPMYIYWSRVGDGICDCCDGSDEWQLGGCEDVCEKRTRAHRQRMEQRMHEMKKGIEAREVKMKLLGQQAEEQRRRLDALRDELPRLEQDVESKKVALQKAQLAAGEDPERKVSEYAKWMETANTGADSSNAAESFSVVQVEHRDLVSIDVKSGDLVDFVTFKYRSGEVLQVGGGNGNQQEPFVLQAGEGLSEVMGSQGGLLDSIQFVTTSGRQSQVYGGKGGKAYSLKAAPGKVIVGLERADGMAGKITGHLECDFEDRRSPEEKARDEAVLALGAARRGLEARQREVQDLEAKITSDFVDGLAVYDMFEEKCGEGRFDKYTYKICLFGDAKQGSTRLGRWSGWQGDSTSKSHVALFKDGERCFSKIVRSLRVTFECGQTLKVEAIREPSQCTYEATMSHPAACDPAIFDFGGGEDSVLRPHQAVHEEL